ncbi:MAG: alpha/beta hydrolase-fold protein [Myxococcota bacterium]
MTRWTSTLSLALFVLGCGARFERELAYTSHESRANNGVVMDYAVFTPPGWTAEERLPLVVFLHGGGDSHDAFDRHGVTDRLEEAMAEGRVPRAVVVLPNGHLGFWANWWNQSRRYEDWIVYEVIPRVRRDYRTQACPENCHIMGVSMGGAGSLRIALHQPGVFRTVASLSGPVLNTDAMLRFVSSPLIALAIPAQNIFGPPDRARVQQEDLYLVWDGPDAVAQDRIFIAWGSEDREMIIEGGRAFHDHLEEHAIPHSWIEYEGNHSWVSWGPVIESAFRANLGDGPQGPVEPGPATAGGEATATAETAPATL